MAVVRIRATRKHNVREYLGLSTDVKPTDCDAGSTFLETDTKHGFVYDGTRWHDLTEEEE